MSTRDQIRARAERQLEDDLSFLGIARRDADLPEQGTSERVAETLRAFQATGLLSQADVAGWRKRFARAADAVRAPDQEAIPSQIRARAAEIVEAHLSELDSGNPERGDPAELARFVAMLSALRRVGAISQEDKDGFEERRDSILELPREPPRPARPASQLLRVLVGPPQRQSGLRVTAAELFADSIRLWWHSVASPEEIAEREREQILRGHEDPPPDWRRAAETFALSDDIGTRYEGQIVGSNEDTPWTWLMPWRMTATHSDPLPLFGRAIFTPAVPEAATHLEAISGSNRFPLGLTG